MNLWPHQERGLDATREALRLGARAPLIVNPTGGGKTRIAATIAGGVIKRGKRVLVLAHRRELVDQAADDFRNNGAPHVAVIRAGKEPDPSQPIQVASIQTLLARNRGVASLMPPADVVIFDEAHHYVADEWQAIAKHYSSGIRIGLTATPQRSDGTSLGNLFDVLINVATIRELTEAGFLVPCDVIKPDDKQGSRTIAQEPVDAYREHAFGTQAIVFCADVEEAQRAAVQFSSVGIAAACVDGKTSAKTREAHIQAFKAGRLRVLTNCFVLTEGFNHPGVETCIIARGCGTVGTYLQIVGRVLRASPGKTRALLLDLTGVYHLHGLPDDDREWTLDGSGYRKPSDAAPIQQCKSCGAVFRPAPQCPRCGATAGAVKPVKVSGAKLSPVERSERQARATEEEKQRYHEWLLREQQSKGYKSGWVHHRFIARFGHAYRGPAIAS